MEPAVGPRRSVFAVVTKERDAAAAALAAWLKENTALARILLVDTPQKLEKLGILARS